MTEDKAVEELQKHPAPVCPHCGDDPMKLYLTEFPRELPTGQTIVLVVLACMNCRKALSGQPIVVPSKIQQVAHPLTLKRGKGKIIF